MEEAEGDMREVGVVGSGVKDEDQDLLLEVPCSDLLVPACLSNCYVDLGWNCFEVLECVSVVWL